VSTHLSQLNADQTAQVRSLPTCRNVPHPAPQKLLWPIELWSVASWLIGKGQAGFRWSQRVTRRRKKTGSP
jgi:hypothetical protein